MCGICGFLDIARSLSQEALEDLSLRMAAAMAHRGPDEGTSWSDPRAGVAFGHRRLAVIDLTPTGRQPMTSRCGSYTIALNGEIYNYRKLRGELEGEGVPFRGSSDTEVVLEGIARWGVEKTLQRMVGMFALALWNSHKQTLTLARDRGGEKPLYYGWMGGTFLFGSDLRALAEHPHFRKELDLSALGEYFMRNYIPAPASIYKGIRKLLPGTYCTFSPEQPGLMPSPVPYWTLEETVRTARENPFTGTPREALEELHQLLRQVLQGQMLADVPLGAFLSGGIDSSLVVGVMQELHSSPVRTFTIGFEEAAFDEAAEAAKVARHLGTNHTTRYVTPREALEMVPQLPRFYSEPFGDSSQIPSCLVASFARQSVTVALSGDGGDELFGGYNRHTWLPRLDRRLGKYPLWSRRVGARALQSLSPAAWDGILQGAGKLTGKAVPRLGGYKVHKLASLLDAPGLEALYRRVTTFWKSPEEILLAPEPFEDLPLEESLPPGLSKEEQIIYRDYASYLPGDGLTKVDRACMSASLEGRAPFLDHRLLAFAWSLPMEYKIRSGTGKWILRELLATYLPRQLFERPKMGFGIPVSLWIRGPLREWACSLLHPSRLRQEGLLAVPGVQKRLKEHLAGTHDHSDSLWGLLMFQQWRESYL
jgi:asparagine synthase (glutamine-hydrolysing)